MRVRRARAVFRLSASMVKVRYLVLTMPLLPLASCFCRMAVYSARMSSKSSPCGAISKLFAYCTGSTSRLRKDSCTWMECSGFIFECRWTPFQISSKFGHDLSSHTTQKGPRHTRRRPSIFIISKNANIISVSIYESGSSFMQIFEIYSSLEI